MGTKELEKKSSGGGLVAAWKQNPLVSTGLVLILMIVVQTAIMIYNFGEGSVGELLLSLLTNWLNILRNNAPVGIIALGMTFVIISGGIDLSVGSTLVAVGAMVMMVVDGSATGLLAGMGITGVPAYIIAIAVGLVFGALLGWLNGVLIAHGKLPPFIATLGTMQIFRSVRVKLRIYMLTMLVAIAAIIPGVPYRLHGYAASASNATPEWTPSPPSSWAAPAWPAARFPLGTVPGILIIGVMNLLTLFQRAPFLPGGLQGHHRHCGRPSAEEGSRRVTLLS